MTQPADATSIAARQQNGQGRVALARCEDIISIDQTFVISEGHNGLLPPNGQE
jgi:hypothetical protein